MLPQTPEKEKFPQEWKKKDALQKLCMMRYPVYSKAIWHLYLGAYALTG